VRKSRQNPDVLRCPENSGFNGKLDHVAVGSLEFRNPLGHLDDKYPAALLNDAHGDSYEMNCSGAGRPRKFLPRLDSLGILGMHT
jgi:hypothetical protein